MKKAPSLKIKLVTVSILALIFVIDLIVPLGVSIGVLYVFCFFLITNQTKQTILVFSFLISFLTLFKLGLFYSSDTTLMSICNRILSIFVIVISTLLALKNRTFYEKTISEREEQFRLLDQKREELERMKKAIDTYLLFSITDTKGKIIYVNDKFCEISKYTKEELVGQNHKIMNSNFHSKEFFKELWKTVASGKVWHNEVNNKAKDGEIFWVDTTVFPIYNKNGKIIQYFCLRIPIDVKKKHELEREEFTNGLKEMLFMTSHKVRQPVTQILGVSEVLSSVRLSQEELTKIVGYMKLSALSLDSFTKELTQFMHEQRLKTEKKTDHN